MSRLHIEDLSQYWFLAETKLSPSAKTAAFLSRKANLEKNGYDLYLNVCDTRSGEVTQLLQSEQIPCFCWEDEETLLVALLRTEEERRTVAEGELLTAFYRVDITTGACRHAFSVPTNAHLVQKLPTGCYLLESWFNAYRPDVEHAEGRRGRACWRRRGTICAMKYWTRSPSGGMRPSLPTRGATACTCTIPPMARCAL